MTKFEHMKAKLFPSNKVDISNLAFYMCTIFRILKSEIILWTH